ncbi:MAG: hypothetical protein KDG50_07080 [Chromatiales bacterium]|nr:hypothetical protein [Chromatiales bacterium]
MRDDVSAYASKDVARNVSIKVFASSTWAALVSETATGGFELGPFAASCRHSSSELAVNLTFSNELYGANQPKPGDLVSVVVDGMVSFNGQIESVSDYREQRGNRSMSITARSRDATPNWRDLRWTTEIYPPGSDVMQIVRDVLRGLGMTGTQVRLPNTSVRTVHSGVQLADMDAWRMLEALFFPLLAYPTIDAVGRFHFMDRDVTREADVELGSDRVVSIQGSRSKAPITAMRIKWLDPSMTKSIQQSQKLATVSLTAGFFQQHQKQRTYWSDDRRQRAQNTYMEIIQSVNSGLLPVGDEDYEIIDDWHGKVTVTTKAWVPTLATAAIVAKLAAHKIPDYAPPFGGPTIPIGRIVEGTADVFLFLTMMSIGSGVYDIYGEPFEWIHQINTTEAYNDASPDWIRNEVEIESDLIVSSEHAQSLAASELLYRSYEPQSWNATIVDDLRIEKGDIVALADGSRLYVTDYNRDLSRGAPAVLALQGFRV